ncbi:MAG: hypothetical protein COA59_07545 [Colwellia sp.]|nr:MAG: hypothetical protein COA59_07545 [Colwellia sp.]
MNIAIIAMEGCYGSSLHGLIDVFVVANAYIKKHSGNKNDFFQWHFLSTTNSTIKTSNGLSMRQSIAQECDKHFDVIFIPGILYKGVHAFEVIIQQQQLFYTWLMKQHQQGAIVCANCTATFFLAESGLLDNKEATTVWWLEPLFKQRYKNITLKFEQLIIEKNNVICAGSATSHFQLGLLLLKKFVSPFIVQQTAKAMLIDTRKMLTSPEQLLSFSREHNNVLVQKAQDWIELNLSRSFKLVDLAREIATTERTLIRQFKNTLSITPSKYIQNLRVNKAKYLLEISELSLDKIIEKVGYQDRSAFTKLFTKVVGIPPMSYRRQF